MNIIKTNFNYRKPLIPLNADKVLFLVIHHTDSVSAPTEQIHKWHLDNGWDGFGYNEMIAKNGVVYIGRGDNIGAHTANMNSKSYGIALEGNYNKETVLPIAQFTALVERLKYHKSRFRNLAEIGPHSKFNPTDCPGRYLNLEAIIREVNKSKSSLQMDIETLQRNIPITPDYWLKYAKTGEICRGDYVAGLIHNVAEYLRKKAP